MKLIIGGAYQGKLAYAKSVYQTEEGWIDGRVCGMKLITECKGIDYFHEYVKRMLEENNGRFSLKSEHLVSLEEKSSDFAKWLKQNNPEILIISNELGYGVVPMEKKDRMWREAVGRLCTSLAAESDEVIRVVCGVGMKLK